MTKYRLALALALAAGLCLSQAAAKTPKSPSYAALDCAMSMGEHNVIAPNVIVLRNLATNEITVYDGLIKQIYDKPIPAKVNLDNDTRLVISWVVKGLRGSNVTMGVKVEYTLVIIKATNIAVQKSTVAGYDNHEKASGRCAPMK